MRQSPTDRKRAERQEWQKAAESVEIGLAAARAMRRAGKLSNYQLEVLERAAKHEHLHSPQLPTEEYVRLRRSGQYDAMAEDAALSSEEVASAELACRRVATWLFSESAQRGDLSAADARAAISPHVAVPGGQDIDDETYVALASAMADQGVDLEKPERVPGWARPEPAITAAEERDFQSRQAGSTGVDTPALRRLRDDAKSDPEHPFAVAGRAQAGLPEEEPTDA